MKVVIFAGGLGSRLQEETIKRPKPLVTIGKKPIIWHIMKIYSNYGFNNFIICLGYKGEMIKKYFQNYNKKYHDVHIALNDKKLEFIGSSKLWNVNLVNTGIKTQTGGRLRKIKKLIVKDKIFCFTYGDGLANININKLVKFHLLNKKICTVTAVQPPARFGVLDIHNKLVKNFKEKKILKGWINGGFFVASPKIINYIKNDLIPWERNPMEKLVIEKNMAAYKHFGFWQCMDTLRDKYYLEEIWRKGNAPWKILKK
jgi:glucose-1-phosphate cytidylyltransferase